MIRINDDYYIDSDTYNFILLKKDINKKNGKEEYDPIAYANKLEQLKTFLFERELKENIDLLNNIDKCIELKRELEDETD